MILGQLRMGARQAKNAPLIVMVITIMVIVKVIIVIVMVIIIIIIDVIYKMNVMEFITKPNNTIIIKRREN